MTLISFILALAAGALVALQIGSNARLKEAAGTALPAIIISSCLGEALLVIAVLTLRQPWPTTAQLVAAPASAWIGGLLGAGYAIVTVVLARHLGAGTLVALVVTGQLLCSVLLDHFGLLGFEVRPATAWRLAGTGFMLGGLLLIWRF